jgi:hypothetical protein
MSLVDKNLIEKTIYASVNDGRIEHKIYCRHSKMDFGRYKGYSIAWFLERNQQYLKWAYNTVERFDLTPDILSQLELKPFPKPGSLNMYIEKSIRYHGQYAMLTADAFKTLLRAVYRKDSTSVELALHDIILGMEKNNISITIESDK